MKFLRSERSVKMDDVVLLERLLRRAVQCFRSKEYVDCVEACSELLLRAPRAPMRAKVLHLAAESNLELERYDQAVRLYTELLDADRRDAVAWGNRGFAHMELGKWEAAAEDYLAVVNLNPSAVGSIRALAECYLELGRADDAIKVILDRAPEDTSHAPIFAVLGDAYIKKRQWVDAYKAFKLAHALDPNDQFAARRLAQLEEQANK
jgi:tetratricopeptide (TPR) repeat protein